MISFDASHPPTSTKIKYQYQGITFEKARRVTNHSPKIMIRSLGSDL